jgi:hypothetical protein
MSRRPSKKQKQRDRREATRRQVPVEVVRHERTDPNAGRGRTRREQAG